MNRTPVVTLFLLAMLLGALTMLAACGGGGDAVEQEKPAKQEPPCQPYPRCVQV